MPAAKHFKGPSKISVTAAELERAVAAGEDVAKLYLRFEWGRTLTPEQATFSQKHGVPVVPSVNTFHYVQGGHGTKGGADPMKDGTAAIKRLRKLGVTEFQIDAVHEPAFR